MHTAVTVNRKTKNNVAVVMTTIDRLLTNDTHLFSGDHIVQCAHYTLHSTTCDEMYQKTGLFIARYSSQLQWQHGHQ